jgi:hypothetical protein
VTEDISKQLMITVQLAMITVEESLDHALVEMKMIVTAAHLTLTPMLPLST